MHLQSPHSVNARHNKHVNNTLSWLYFSHCTVQRSPTTSHTLSCRVCIEIKFSIFFSIYQRWELSAGVFVLCVFLRVRRSFTQKTARTLISCIWKVRTLRVAMHRWWVSEIFELHITWYDGMMLLRFVVFILKSSKYYFHVLNVDVRR